MTMLEKDFGSVLEYLGDRGYLVNEKPLFDNKADI